MGRTWTSKLRILYTLCPSPSRVKQKLCGGPPIALVESANAGFIYIYQQPCAEARETKANTNYSLDVVEWDCNQLGDCEDVWYAVVGAGRRDKSLGHRWDGVREGQIPDFERPGG